MKKSDIDSYLSGKKYDELINLLRAEIDDDDEFSLLTLSRCYCTVNDEKSAKKIAKRYKNLFPAGEYIVEIEDIISDTARGVYKDNAPEVKPEPSLSEVKSAIPAKKTRKVPQNINECFEEYGIYGMDAPKEKLGTFYNQLRLQREREQAKINFQIVSSSNFVISGARGCGKTTLSRIIANMLCDFGIRARSEISTVSPRKLLDVYSNDHDTGIADFFGNNNEDVIVIENVQDIIEDDNQGASLKGMFEKLRDYMKNANSSIIITGTDDTVNKMLGIDPDIRDCMYDVIKIDKYSNMELLRILMKLAGEKGFFIDKTAEKVVLRKIDIESRSTEFMNAISLDRMLNEAIKKISDRYSQSDDDSDLALVTLLPQDFSNDFEDESLDELLSKLDGMIGLANVKAQIKKKVNNVLAQMQADEAGAGREAGHGTLHMLFTGNPGTGKTTIASLLGRIYQQLNILPNGGQIVYCTRSDVVGKYQGHTASLVKEKFKEAEGGILFIDEAYSLYHDKMDTFGKEAVDEIIAQMENRKDTLMVILAGYKKEMENFLRESNPGWRSRIKDTIEFDDYSVDEMTAIFEGLVSSYNMRLGEGCREVIHSMIEVKSKAPDFGNARGVRNLFEDVLSEQSERTVSMKVKGQILSGEDYDTILAEDIEKISGRKSFNEKSLDDLLAELNSLTGLKAAKDVVNQLVDSVQMMQYRMNKGLSQDEGFGTLHLLFKGSAGTGKTTVARLLAQIYVKLGVLKKNIVVEANRGDLVGEYLGQTAQKVLSVLDRADGGVLFIDEAYSLYTGQNDNYGLEAINTLVPELENRRSHLMVILAGYSSDMDKFLETNQGLASRLSREVVFEDYTVDELVSIFKSMVGNEGLILDGNISDEMISSVIEDKKEAVKDFANARGVRNLVDDVKRKMNTRLVPLIRSGEEIADEELITVKKEDL